MSPQWKVNTSPGNVFFSLIHFETVMKESFPHESWETREMVLHVVIEGLHNGLVDWDPQHEDVLRECQVGSQQRYPLSRQIMDAVRQRWVHWRDKTAKGQDSTASESPSRLQQLLDEMSPKYSLFQLNTGGVGITQTTIQAGDVVIELAGPEASEGVVVCCILQPIDPRSPPISHVAIVRAKMLSRSWALAF
jgi:hypothetical protein